MAIAASFYMDEYIIPSKPFWLAGASGKSNGDANISRSANEISIEFIKMLEFSWHPTVPYVKTMRACMLDSFLHACDKNNMQLQKSLKINYARYAVSLEVERNRYNANEIDSLIKEIKFSKKLGDFEINFERVKFKINFFSKYLNLMWHILLGKILVHHTVGLDSVDILNAHQAAKYTDQIFILRKNNKLKTFIRYAQKIKYP
jgi:hypothetical protein